MKTKLSIWDIMRISIPIILIWLYLPHLVLFVVGGGKKLIKSDLKKMKNLAGNVILPEWIILLNLLHYNRYYRVLFYHRIGVNRARWIKWYCPGDKYFTISPRMKIGDGMWIAHPYATILNAESIGKNFSCIHCTTVGATDKGIPVIGDNVFLCANVTIVGPVHIGSNVIIGAGSVVVKDIPDNCVVAGNPAKVIKFVGRNSED